MHFCAMCLETNQESGVGVVWHIHTGMRSHRYTKTFTLGARNSSCLQMFKVCHQKVIGRQQSQMGRSSVLRMSRCWLERNKADKVKL